MKKLIKKNKEVCIIGNGTAGICAAEEITARDPDTRITVFSAELEPFYYRASILNHMSGRITRKQLLGRPEQFYKETKIRVINRAIIEIDTTHQIVLDERGKKHNYDALLLATGAIPNRQEHNAQVNEKTFVIRSIEDCQQLKTALSSAKKVAILGGGFLGIEIAENLQKDFNIAATIISKEQYMLERFISLPVSEIYFKKLTQLGIRFFFDSSTKNIIQHNNGLRITLDNGETIDCDLLIESIGVHPNKQLAQAASINTGKGILVNENLQTSVKNVFAAGDCAEIMSGEINNNYISGFHPVASIQGRIAGANIAGAQAFFFPRMAIISAQIASINFTQIGHMEKSKPSHYFLESTINGNNYKKILMDDNKIISAFFSGEFRELNLILELINTKRELSDRFLNELKRNNLGFFRSIDYL